MRVCALDFLRISICIVHQQRWRRRRRRHRHRAREESWWEVGSGKPTTAMFAILVLLCIGARASYTELLTPRQNHVFAKMHFHTPRKPAQSCTLCMHTGLWTPSIHRFLRPVPEPSPGSAHVHPCTVIGSAMHFYLIKRGRVGRAISNEERWL